MLCIPLQTTQIPSSVTSPSSHSTGYPTTTTDSNQSRAHPCTEQNFTLAIAGAKDRDTNQVRAQVVERTDKPTVHGFVAAHVAPDAKVYTDDALVYETLPNPHEVVNHSAQEYVRGDVHTNGAESFWSMLKRAHKGTFHKMSPKHLDRYVQEFAARHNLRDEDTIDIMAAVITGMNGKRLRYVDLIADNGLDSGARTG